MSLRSILYLNLPIAFVTCRSGTVGYTGAERCGSLMKRSTPLTAYARLTEQQPEEPTRRLKASEALKPLLKSKRWPRPISVWPRQRISGTPTYGYSIHPDGTIDLRTGEKRDNDPSDYMTKTTVVAPGGDCPLFMEFLDRITDGNNELQDFLQRIFGYSLTGSIQEHALFFFYGLGGNGKSVLVETVSGILGDYTEVAPVETFTASKSERHPTELAKLRGARLVTAIETEEGRYWAEAKIKTLTGGDKITARFMRGNYFDFVPAFKLVIAGNHKPRIKTVDEAIRRRFNLVPFTVTIPPEERDLNLGEKLKAEWPGILQWMIAGCMEWQKLGGLNAPQSVLDATAEYLEGEDAMAAWIDEECELDPRKADSSTTLYESWKAWADKAGEWSGSQKQFSQKMVERGFEKKKMRRGAQFMGIAAMPGSKFGEA